MLNNATGFGNTALGYLAGNTFSQNTNNTYLGHNTNASANTVFNATAIGPGVITNAAEKTVIGTNTFTTVVGGYVDWSILSDGRFKERIKEDVPGLDFIEALRPVTYTIDVMRLHQHITAQMPDSTAWKYQPEPTTVEGAKRHIRTGFIAQEVESAAQAIGYEFDGLNKPTNPTDNYSLSYASFVPSLVKATQEQQEIIEEQAARIDRLETKNLVLENRLAELEARVEQLINNQPQEQSSIILHQAPSLDQNQPNPTSGTTRVGYFLPQGKTGELVITAIDGKELQRITLTQKGKGQVDLQTQNLPAGTYNYSLVVEGQIADTKRMVILQ